MRSFSDFLGNNSPERYVSKDGPQIGKAQRMPSEAQRERCLLRVNPQQQWPTKSCWKWSPVVRCVLRVNSQQQSPTEPWLALESGDGGNRRRSWWWWWRRAVLVVKRGGGGREVRVASKPTTANLESVEAAAAVESLKSGGSGERWWCRW
jgi:hypothetical protein